MSLSLVVICNKTRDPVHQELIIILLRMPSICSQLHCVHFGSWDNNKDWSVSLTAKESICSIAVGDGWIAIATNKQMLRLFSVGGVQREVISVPGHLVTVSGWGGRLAIVYQAGPCKCLEDKELINLLNFHIITCTCI